MNNAPLGNLKNKIIAALVLGLAVVAGLSLFADLPKLAASLRSFDWRLLPLALALTFGNYLLRFVKWHYYLERIGVTGLSKLDSLLIFFTGLSMVVTPGRVGEWLKSYLLREAVNTPVSVSAPVIVAERLTDAVAVLLLASVGLAAYGYGWQIVFVVALGAGAVVYLSQHRAVARRLFRFLHRVPLVAKRVDALQAFYESAHQLLKPKSLLVATVLSVFSWFGECAAFYVVLLGLGLPAGPLLLFQATFILATATLVGAVSMLPGGLAAAEGSIAGLLLLLAVMHDPATAAAATLIVRFCTLWIGVFLGLLALAVFAPRLAGENAAAD